MANERVEIKDINHALDYINNPRVSEVYNKFILDYKIDSSLSGVYTSKQVVLDIIKERVLDKLNEEYLNIREKISDMRKKGIDVNYYDYRILRFPLKMKFFKVNFSLKVYEKIRALLTNSSEEVDNFFQENKDKFEEPKAVREENVEKSKDAGIPKKVVKKVLKKKIVSEDSVAKKTIPKKVPAKNLVPKKAIKKIVTKSVMTKKKMVKKV